MRLPAPTPLISNATTPTKPTPAREPGLRLILLYKLLKAGLALSTALVFAFLLATGSDGHLHGLAGHLRKNVTAAWSVLLADAIVSVTERRHLVVATAALFLDGFGTIVEWWALHHGRRWGEWLVVVATSSFVPFEVVALVRHHHLGRFLVLVVNVAVIAYLLRHVVKRLRRARLAETFARPAPG